MLKQPTLMTVMTCAALVCGAFVVSPAAAQDVNWRNILNQPDDWFGSPHAIETTRRVLQRQQSTGGWNKNFDYTREYTQQELAQYNRSNHPHASTIDNGATTKEMIFLARVYRETGDPRCRDAFLRGMDYLLEAQYPNGGWPQFYPQTGGAPYSKHITYNDDAMVRVLNLLRDVAEGEPDYTFVDPDRRQAAASAVSKGVECILATQIIVDGRRTAWCAQHDRDTLQPAGARTYEHPSISGGESVNIVRFLMSIDDPSPQTIDAIQSAMRWFDDTKIVGYTIAHITDESGRYDRVLARTSDDRVLWARFYEIGTNRPIFSGRDGVVKYDLTEVEYERRTNYGWYTHRAETLLSEDYPAWQATWAPHDNVLEH